MPNDHSGFQSLGVIINKAPITLGNDDLTPSVSGGNIFKCATAHTAAKDISMFDDGVSGQVIIIIGANPTYKSTIKDQGNLLINGDWLEESEATLTLVFDGTNWYEIARRHS